MPGDSEAYDSVFPPTIWVGVQSAGAGNDAAAGELYCRYQRPLQTYLHYKFTLPEVQAHELVHDFLSRKLTVCAAKADPQKGKFRNLLLTSLVNDVLDWIKKQNAGIHKPPGGFVSIDNPDVGEISAPLTETQVELEWTRIVIAEALRRVQVFYVNKGKTHFWQAFEGRIVQPMLNDTEPLSVGELVAQHGFESPQAVSNALVDAERKFARFLHEVTAEYATNQHAAETEVRELKNILWKEAAMSTLHNVFRSDQSHLSKLMDLSGDPRNLWRPEEFGELWRQQLETTLAFDLTSHIDQPTTTFESAAGSSAQAPRTFRELLQHPSAPLELLILAKDFAKTHANGQGAMLPHDIAMGLYYAVIAAARVRHNQRITSLDDGRLKQGCEWALAQPWLDSATSELLSDLVKRLGLV